MYAKPELLATIFCVGKEWEISLRQTIILGVVVLQTLYRKIIINMHNKVPFPRYCHMYILWKELSNDIIIVMIYSWRMEISHLKNNFK